MISVINISCSLSGWLPPCTQKSFFVCLWCETDVLVGCHIIWVPTWPFTSPLDGALQGLTNHRAPAGRRLNQPPWAAKWSEAIHLAHKHTHACCDQAACVRVSVSETEEDKRAHKGNKWHPLQYIMSHFTLVLSLPRYIGFVFPCALSLSPSDSFFLSALLSVLICALKKIGLLGNTWKE